MTDSTVKIKVVYSDRAFPLVKATEGSAGWDVCATEYYTLSDNHVTMVNTGIKIESPHGYEAQIRSRSGLALSIVPIDGIVIANGVGTIDSDYRGVVKVLMYSISGIKHIKRGDRVAQLVISKVQDAEFVAVDTLSDTQRGAGGFGSTGK